MPMLCFKCPSCWEKFRVEMNSVPRFCPNCGHDSKEQQETEEERMRKIIATQQPPKMTKTILKVVDNLNREMEDKSKLRAELAQEYGGLSSEEANAMKITNMGDNLRAGDNAAKPMMTPAQKSLESQASMKRDPVIEEFRLGARQGPFAGSGVSSMIGLQQRFFGRTPERI